MKAQTKVVVSLIVVSALAITAVSGVTYSWFSDTESSDITITTGKVDVSMDAGNLALYSYDGTEGKLKEVTGNFTNGGSATLKVDGGKASVIMNNATPGDAIRFTLDLKNNSTIAIKWILNVFMDSETSKYVTCNKADPSTIDFNTWSNVVASDTSDLGKITVEIAIPTSAGNEYQGMSSTVTIQLDAYQANAIDDNAIYIYTPDQLVQLADGLVNNQSQYKGKTVTIMNNLDMTGKVWPIINLNDAVNTLTIKGVNNSITISNLNIDGAGENTGFIAFTGSMTSLTIEDLVFDSIKVSSEDHKANGIGAIIGYAGTSESININGCQVKNSVINGGHWAGGLVGYAAGYSNQGNGPVFEELNISDCSVIDSEITSPGSVGGVIGHATGDAWTRTTINDCKVDGNTIECTGSSAIKAGSLIGTVGVGQTTSEGNGGVFVNNATVGSNTVKSNGVENKDYIYGRQGSAGGVLEIGGTPVTFPNDRKA